MRKLPFASFPTDFSLHAATSVSCSNLVSLTWNGIKFSGRLNPVTTAAGGRGGELIRGAGVCNSGINPVCKCTKVTSRFGKQLDLKTREEGREITTAECVRQRKNFFFRSHCGLIFDV